MIEHLFNGERNHCEAEENLLTPPVEQRDTLLLRALHRSITQCASQTDNTSRYRLLLPRNPTHAESPTRDTSAGESECASLEAAGFLFHPRRLEWHQVESSEELMEFLRIHLDAFKADGGTTLLLYALVLTRGIKQVFLSFSVSFSLSFPISRSHFFFLL